MNISDREMLEELLAPMRKKDFGVARPRAEEDRMPIEEPVQSEIGVSVTDSEIQNAATPMLDRLRKNAGEAVTREEFEQFKKEFLRSREQ